MNASEWNGCSEGERNGEMELVRQAVREFVRNFNNTESVSNLPAAQRQVEKDLAPEQTGAAPNGR